MITRLLASPACLAIATALLAAPAVAQAPASSAPPAPATMTPAAAAPATMPPAAAAPMPAAPAHAARSHAMHAQRVERLQTALNANGAKLAVDGKMGPKTHAALLAFQKAHGLKATGRVDKETIAALRKTS